MKQGQRAGWSVRNDGLLVDRNDKEYHYKFDEKMSEIVRLLKDNGYITLAIAFDKEDIFSAGENMSINDRGPTISLQIVETDFDRLLV